MTRAIKLLDLYGDEVFAAAVAEIVARGLRDTGALAVACDRLRKERRRRVCPFTSRSYAARESLALSPLVS